MSDMKIAKTALRCASVFLLLSLVPAPAAWADRNAVSAAIRPLYVKAVAVINYRIETDRISRLLDKQRVARRVLTETILAKAQGLEQEALEELIDQSIGVLTTSAGEIGESLEEYGRGIQTGLDVYEKYGLATDLYNDGMAETLKGQLLSKIPYYDLLASVAKITKMFVKFKDIEYQMEVLRQYDNDLKRNQVIFGRTKEVLGQKLADALGSSQTVDRQAEGAMLAWARELARIINTGDLKSLDIMEKYLGALTSAYKVVAGKSTNRHSTFKKTGASALSATKRYLQSKSELQSTIGQAKNFLERSQINKFPRYIGKCKTVGMTPDDHALIQRRQATITAMEKTHQPLNLATTEDGVDLATEIENQLNERSPDSQIELASAISKEYRAIYKRLAEEARVCELKPGSYKLGALSFSLTDSAGRPILGTDGGTLAADALTAAVLSQDRYRSYQIKGRYVQLTKKRCCFTHRTGSGNVQNCDTIRNDANWETEPSPGSRVADFFIKDAKPRVAGGRIDAGQQQIYPVDGADKITASLAMPGVKVVRGDYYEGFHPTNSLDCKKASDALEPAKIKAKVVLSGSANQFTMNPPDAEYEINVARTLSFEVIGETGEPMEEIDLLPRRDYLQTPYHHRVKLILKYSLGGKEQIKAVLPESLRFDIQGKGLRLDTGHDNVTILGSGSTDGILRIMVKNTETDALETLKSIPVRSARIQTEVVLPEIANRQFASDHELLPVGEKAKVRVFSSGKGDTGGYRVRWWDGKITPMGQVRMIGFDSYSTDADGNFQPGRIHLEARIISKDGKFEGPPLAFSPASFQSTWPVVTAMRLEPAGADIFLPINKNEQAGLVPPLTMKLGFRDGSKQTHKTFAFKIPGTMVSFDGMSYIDSASLGTHVITEQIETTIDQHSQRGMEGLFVENDVLIDRAIFTINRMEVDRLGEDTDSAYRLRIDGPASMSGYAVRWTDDNGKTLITAFNGRESIADNGQTFAKVALTAQGGRIAGQLDLAQWTPLPPPAVGPISVSAVPMVPGTTVNLSARVEHLRVWGSKENTGYYAHWEAVPTGAGRFLENDIWLSGYGHTDNRKIETQFELFDAGISPASVDFTLKIMRRDAVYGGSTDD